MKVSSNPRGRFFAAFALRRNFSLMLVIAASLLIVGCKRNSNLDIGFMDSPNSNNTNQTTTTTTTQNNNTDMKGMADKQGQATKPDKGNFSVQYSNVRNPRYAQIN